MFGEDKKRNEMSKLLTQHDWAYKKTKELEGKVQKIKTTLNLIDDQQFDNSIGVDFFYPSNYDKRNKIEQLEAKNKELRRTLDALLSHLGLEMEVTQPEKEPKVVFKKIKAK